MSTEKVEPKQLKIMGYMSALYDVFSNEAANQEQPIEGEVLIWQGRLIKTCTSIGIPEGYYKRVVDTLRAMGCIEVLNQGRRGKTLTAIALRYPPTSELYEEAIVKSGWQDLTAGASLDTLGADVRNLQRQIGGIDIQAALVELDKRFRKIETALGSLQDEVNNINSNNNAQ